MSGPARLSNSIGFGPRLASTPVTFERSTLLWMEVEVESP